MTAERLADVFLEKFRREFIPGDKLPTQAALADEYGAKEYRVIRALKLLGKQGVTESQQGSGWYLTSHERAGEPDPVAELAGEVADLRQQVGDLARDPAVADPAVSGDVREKLAWLVDKVNHLEDALTDLYGKVGYTYPHGGAHDSSTQRESSGDRRAQASG